MLAKSNQSIEDAATTVYQLTQEEKIRQQMEAREDYYRRTSGREELLRESIAKVERLTSENSQLTSEKSQLISENSQLSSENALLKKLLNKHGIKISENGL